MVHKGRAKWIMVCHKWYVCMGMYWYANGLFRRVPNLDHHGSGMMISSDAQILGGFPSQSMVDT